MVRLAWRMLRYRPAGATRRIAVNSNVIIAPLHHPVRLAKAVATLDVLSGGRVMVTLGTGMAPGEFSALGVDFTKENVTPEGRPIRLVDKGKPVADMLA